MLEPLLEIAVLGQLSLFFELLAFTRTAITWASALQKLLVLAVAPGTFADPEEAEKTATDQTA